MKVHSRPAGRNRGKFLIALFAAVVASCGTAALLPAGAGALINLGGQCGGQMGDPSGCYGGDVGGPNVGGNPGPNLGGGSGGGGSWAEEPPPGGVIIIHDPPQPELPQPDTSCSFQLCTPSSTNTSSSFGTSAQRPPSSGTRPPTRPKPRTPSETPGKRTRPCREIANDLKFAVEVEEAWQDRESWRVTDPTMYKHVIGAYKRVKKARAEWNQSGCILPEPYQPKPPIT